jgi:hypothetical protein
MAKRGPQSKRHHLDRRIDQILAALDKLRPDQVLDTPKLAEVFGVSPQWLEIGRCRGWGPPFERGYRYSYQIPKVRKWLTERQRARKRWEASTRHA